MKWAIGSGYYIAAGQFAAILGGTRIQILESELGIAMEVLKSSAKYEAKRLSNDLNRILRNARRTGGNMQVYATQIEAAWRRFDEKCFLHKPTTHLRERPAFWAGLSLGFAYMYCSAKHPGKTPDGKDAVLIYLDGAAAQLQAIKDSRLPGFNYDFNRAVADIKERYKCVATPGNTGLRTVADFIDALYGNVRDQFPGP